MSSFNRTRSNFLANQRFINTYCIVNFEWVKFIYRVNLSILKEAGKSMKGGSTRLVLFVLIFVLVVCLLVCVVAISPFLFPYLMYSRYRTSLEELASTKTGKKTKQTAWQKMMKDVKIE